MTDIAIVIGARLRAHRNNSGLSQEELAEKAGLHGTYIGQLERGEKNATLMSIAKVANALDLPLEVLFENILPQGKTNSTAMDCYNLISGLSRQEQLAISNIIVQLIEFRKM